MKRTQRSDARSDQAGVVQRGRLSLFSHVVVFENICVVDRKISRRTWNAITST